MSGTLDKRIGAIERKLELSKVQIKVVRVVKFDHDFGHPEPEPPEPVERWLTYRAQLDNPVINGMRFIVVSASDELKARATAAQIGGQ
ncbi:MAG: hypothetical protein GXY33_21515 [Phycisphaerae bacterium]|nr:hypothetical protein [Phycisphaerae bacterium]